MTNYYFFIEYEGVHVNNLSIPSYFFEMGFCEKEQNGAIRFKITGLLENNGIFFIVLPKGMKIPEDNKEKGLIIHLLLETLKKYSSNKYIEAEEAVWMGKNASSRIFEIVDWIIEDYRQNSLLHTKRRKEVINGYGRVEWSKTIRKKSPIILNNKMYYLELITSKNDIVSDQELTIIHSLILKKISEKYGVIFNFNFIHELPNTEFSSDYMLYILKKSLRSTNVDREIRLLKNLIAFLTNNSTGKVNIFATKYFANIWEAACAKFIGDLKLLYNLVPNPYWLYKNKKYYTSQIPDILLKVDKDLFIFDAKYYRIEKGIDKLPGWGDIVKQLYYSMSLRGTSAQVYNAFLFPSSNVTNYEYLGYTSVEGKESEFDKVFAFSLDVQLILKYYVGMEKESNKTKIVSEMLSLIKQLKADL